MTRRSRFFFFHKKKIPYQFKFYISTVRADLSLPTPFLRLTHPPPNCDFVTPAVRGLRSGGCNRPAVPAAFGHELGSKYSGTAGRLQLLVVIRNTSIFEIRLLSTVTFNILIEKTNLFLSLLKKRVNF